MFRTGVDPVQLYISIAGEGYFYLSNRYTLSQIFEPRPDGKRRAGRARAPQRSTMILQRVGLDARLVTE